MLVRQPRHSPEEASLLGEALYDNTIRPQVEADNNGKYVAIDIETGAWEIDADENTASDRLLARVPDSQTYVTRIGYGYIRRFGAGRVKQSYGQPIAVRVDAVDADPLLGISLMYGHKLTVEDVDGGGSDNRAHHHAIMREPPGECEVA